MPKRQIQLSLSENDVRLLLDGLDSHEYWELSDEDCRSSGFVYGAGSADPEKREQIRRVRALFTRIESALRKGAAAAQRPKSPAASG